LLFINVVKQQKLGSRLHRYNNGCDNVPPASTQSTDFSLHPWRILD